MKQFVLMLALMLGIGSHGIADEMPPITNKATGFHQQGRFLWYELMTESPRRSVRFYKSLFDWQSMKVSLGGEGLTMLWNKGRPVCAVIERERDESEEAGAVWLGYVSVSKLDASIANLKKRGGEVLIPVTTVENRGRLAIMKDSSGGLIGMFETKDGDPPDRSGRTGEWFWSQLLTVDGGKSKAFYQRGFGYKVLPDRRSSSAEDYLMISQNKSRAGMSPHPDADAKRAEWLHFVRVADIDATIQRARKLGAQVLVASNGEVAVLSDPLGAVFGLIHYEEKGGAE